jgi:hypothetical protein
MAGIGLTPSGPVVTENIRNLQRRGGHGRRRLRRQPVFPSFGPLARLRQLIERAFNTGDHPGGDAGVARRRFQFVVSQRTRVILSTSLRY